MFGRNRGKGEEKPLERYVRDVEHILKKLNINLEEARQQLEGDDYGWEFRRGSHRWRFISPNVRGKPICKFFPPLMYLPQSNLLPLYRRLLELNLQMTSASLGIYNDVVYVFSERPVDGLDAEEADTLIDSVSGYADELDNTLVNEFGGRLYLQV